MSSGRTADTADPVGINAVLLCIVTNKSDGALGILYCGGMAKTRSSAVVDGKNRVACLSECLEKTVVGCRIFESPATVSERHMPSASHDKDHAIAVRPFRIVNVH